MTEPARFSESDEAFLGEVFDLAVRFRATGEAFDLDALVAAREHLRDEILRTIELASDVAVIEQPRADATPALSIDGYSIIDEVGRGGAGIVYRAREARTGQCVALKVLAPSLLASRRCRERFSVEAEALRRVTHQNVVGVRGIVAGPDVCAYAMEWIDGPTLAAAITSGGAPRDAGAVARLGAGVARALEAIHAAGLIHRDVKPANILLRRDGTPMLSDFGLVRDADHSLHTATGEFVGTAAYAAPEQLRGEQDAIGPWTDVYAVGVTLYTALAGETPFGAAPAAEMVRRVERGRCRPLRARAPHVPADLEAVIARAMHKRPERRYRSASALLCDLERVLRFEPVEARPVALGSAVGALAARHPVPMLMTAALLAAGAFVAGGATARPAPPSSPAPPPVALAAGGALGAAIARAQAAIEVADVRDALRALDEAPAGEREFEWEYLRALCSSSRVLGHSAGNVKTLAVAPNGRQVAVGGHERAVRIFDVADGALSGRIPISDWTRTVAFTPDGSRLLVGTAELEVFDVATGASVVRHRAPGRINSVAMRHDGSAIAIGCDSGRVLVFDAAPLLVPRPGVVDLPSPSFEGPRHATPIRRVVFGGDWIAAGSSDGAVVMDGSHGAERHRIPDEGIVDDLAPHPDGRLLAVAGPRGAVIWDVVKGVRLQECEGHRAGAISVAWSGDGRLLASGSIDRTVRMFTSTSADLFATLVGHESDVVAVAFAGATLVSAGERAPDTSIRAWCPEALPLCGLQLRVGDRAVTGLPDPLGRWWACVCPVGTTSSVAIGSLAAPGAPAARLMRSAAGITVAAAPDGAFAAFLGVEGVAIYSGEDLARFARERDAPKPEPVEITQPVGGTATVAAWARGPFIAVGGADGAVVVREVGGSGRQLKGPGGSVQAIACDRGGARVVAALSDRVVFWDFATGREAGGIPEAGFSALAVAPDGGVIATCRPGPKPAVRLWSSVDGSLLGELAGHDDAVRCLAFSPGGTRLVSGSDDRAIRVWDWMNRRSVATLREHTGGVCSAAWTLDGRHLLSGSQDGRLFFRRIPRK